MKKEKLQNIANQIIQLEQECQKGINISENLQKMEILMRNIQFNELFELNEIIEKKFLTF